MRCKTTQHWRDREISGMEEADNLVRTLVGIFASLRLLCFASAGLTSLDLALRALVNEPMRAGMT